MRWALAGLLVLILSSAAWAQARGQVLSVGFDNRYRPDCWTPMLVQLTSQIEQPTVYQIQVVQEDLDRDRVAFTQEVTLGGNLEGRSATTENFWIYFKPKPTAGGLPDARNLATNLQTLNTELKVFLCTKDGKQLCVLPLTSTILNVDPIRGLGDVSRSRKLVLFVTDGSDKPAAPSEESMPAVLEDVEAIALQPRDLPTSILGYDAVDAIVWMDADANFLTSGTRAPALQAIRQWVRQGGHLVICQPPEPGKIKPFADLLPVSSSVDGRWAIPISDRPDIDVLRRFGRFEQLDHPWPPPGSFPPMKVARAPALSDAKVDEWMQWSDPPQFTPWLARRVCGLGAVTWVAQDLGNPILTRQIKRGWRSIWDRVFDWNNAPDVPEDYKPPEDGLDPWKPAAGLDLAAAMRNGMDLSSKAAAFVLVACFFFVIYWLIAGPGMYLFLASRKRAHLSWFMFAATAVAATALTALLVRLLVRGPPELHHLSLIRCAADDSDALIDSRFGLYIPQDGLKKIDLAGIDPRQLSTLTPFAIPPQDLHDEDVLPAYLEYQVPVFPSADSDVISVSIPYRSTSKKLQTHWVGPLSGRIQVPVGLGDVKLIAPGNNGYLDGTLANHTGYDLLDVYIAFKQSPTTGWNEPSTRDYNYLIYLPSWPKDALVRLQDLTSNKYAMNLDNPDAPRPGGNSPVHGRLERELDWDRYWHTRSDELHQRLEEALPLLTLFDRLPPWRNQLDGRWPRLELYHRTARWMNLSPAVSAGELVICAVASIDGDIAKTPLPVPLSVSDSPVAGQGTTMVQFVLPLDRSAMYAMPTTRPEMQ